MPPSAMSLHAGWAAANVAFMRSGGYSLSAHVRQVAQRVLLLWGRHDEIVDPMFAKRYLADLRDCRRASQSQQPHALRVFALHRHHNSK